MKRLSAELDSWKAATMIDKENPMRWLLVYFNNPAGYPIAYKHYKDGTNVIATEEEVEIAKENADLINLVKDLQDELAAIKAAAFADPDDDQAGEESGGNPGEYEELGGEGSIPFPSAEENSQSGESHFRRKRGRPRKVAKQEELWGSDPVVNSIAPSSDPGCLTPRTE